MAEETSSLAGIRAGPMADKTVVITGCTQGIGKETAVALAGMGARVVMACRNLPAAEIVAEEIRAKYPGAFVVVGPRALDLASQASVREYAAAYRQTGWPLHVLINNAGGIQKDPWFTPEGVGGLCQINYLGPYTLTRELEQTLIRSAPSRVVNLSSVTHRMAFIGDPSTFLTNWKQGSKYPNTKLANAMFAFELQRRLGSLGVQSCAVDPGGVGSSIWKYTIFDKPPFSWAISTLYAPNHDGATAVIYAATVPWEKDATVSAAITAKYGSWYGNAAEGRDGVPGSEVATPPEDLRFYARGLFAWPTVTSTRGIVSKTRKLDTLRGRLFGLSTVLHSAMDWPVRRLSRGWIASTTSPVPAAPITYDRKLAAELWDVSADAAGVPRMPKVSSAKNTSIRAKSN